jgi:hypothetical protein
MDPASPPGWKADQREFAEWSDGYASETCSSTSSSMFTDVDEDDDTGEVEGHVKSFEYYKLIQVKKVYKVILEEEDLIM